MKNLRKFAISRAGIISIFSIGMVLFLVSTTERKTKKNIKYDVLQSKIIISGMSNEYKWALEANDVKCGGNFEFKDDELLNISDLSFVLPVKGLKSEHHQLESVLQEIFKVNNCQQLTFKQEHLMILPVIKMAHVLGGFNMVNGGHTVPLQLHYELNENQQLRIWGKQSISLTEFGIQLPDYEMGIIKDEIVLEIDLILVNKTTHIANAI